MVRNKVPFQEPTPSTDTDDKDLPAKLAPAKKADTKHRATPASALPYELLAGDNPGYHARHWGINE